MNLFEIIQKPGYQVLLFISMTIILSLITRPGSADKIWVIAGLMYLLFMLTNSFLLFFEKEIWYYFFVSLGCSLLYIVVIDFIIKNLIKLLRSRGAEESAMIFLVVIFHPGLLLASIFLRWIF